MTNHTIAGNADLLVARGALLSAMVGRVEKELVRLYGGVRDERAATFIYVYATQIACTVCGGLGFVPGYQTSPPCTSCPAVSPEQVPPALAELAFPAPLNLKQREALATVAHNDRFGWRTGIGRSGVSQALVADLLGAGLVEETGLAVTVDGDGFTKVPERWGPSIGITPRGRAAQTMIDHEERQRMDKILGVRELYEQLLLELRAGGWATTHLEAHDTKRRITNPIELRKAFDATCGGQVWPELSEGLRLALSCGETDPAGMWPRAEVAPTWARCKRAPGHKTKHQNATGHTWVRLTRSGAR